MSWMTVGYAQTDPRWGEREPNFREVEDLVGTAQMDLLVLPELFATGYTFLDRDELAVRAEPLDGDTAVFLQGLAQDIGGVVVAGFPEADGEDIYNSSMMVDGEGILARYRKIHLFHEEKGVFTPGDRPFEVHAVEALDGARIGMMVCFDWIFPESVRSLALAGADVIAHPANLVLPYCQRAMRTRCLCNRVFTVTCNRIGTEERTGEGYTFTGQSQITDPGGEVLVSGPGDRTHLGMAEIDLEEAREKKLKVDNDVLADRRPHLYWS